MNVTYERCCGLDVHKESVVACLLVGGAGDKVKKTIEKFGTTTVELLKLLDWLQEAGCTHVVMESTGVYWKPIFNILEGSLEVWLVNARHVKQVPGRKTDVRDCEWLANLMRHGLLCPSFIPPKPTRILREYTRYRRKLLQQRASELNRLQKVLEDANIKLGSVVADVLGVSSRAMLEALVEGEADGKKLAGLARGTLRAKHVALAEALQGRVEPHHRFLIREILGHIDYLDESVRRLTDHVEECLRPFQREIERLDAIPGVNVRTLQDVLAEIGTDMDRFPTAQNLASWAGLCPGNNESAGKRLSGKTRKGSRWLRAALVEAAWGAARKKGSYYQALFRRLAKREKKKAAVGVAHSLLVTMYHLLKRGTEYKDLGDDHFDRINKEATKRGLVKKLQRLGYEVTVKEQVA